MPILPLFNANNTFQGLKGAVKAGRRESGRRKVQEKRREEAKIVKGNEAPSHPVNGLITVKRFVRFFLFQIYKLQFHPRHFPERES